MTNNTIKCSQCGNSNLQQQLGNVYKCDYCGGLTSIIETIPAQNDLPSDNSEFNETLVSIVSKEGFLKAVAYHHSIHKVNLQKSKEYVEKLCAHRNIKLKKGACFIATACYGSYDAPEVICLRKYRDEVLMKSIFGNLLVKVYYLLSPPVAFILKRNMTLKLLVKSYIIEPIISSIVIKDKINGN